MIEISGPIVTNNIEASLFSDEVKGSEALAGEIESADSRSDVKSVLVLIDSPGGSVVGSRQIYDALHSLNKSSVSYINEMAASGGYYAAAGTDHIVANPDAITGSIGARATFYDMAGLFEKIGFNQTTIKSGAMKDIGSEGRPMTEEERAVLQSIVNESFQEFKSAVEASRAGKLDAAGWAIAQDARIMTGRQAKKIGLVDQLGSRKDAVAKAAELGGIKGEPRLCWLSSGKGQKGLFGSLSSEALDMAVRSYIGFPRLSYQ
ncbi:ATP-dependent Clp protease proteolytic subunit [uncultured archaeon]|nr:ATP-dependent Clp protease proteolytic subunit [uncultured archaeon]